MPRPSEGIRLHLRAAKGDRQEVYYIRHVSRSISTECGIDQLEQANQKLALNTMLRLRWVPLIDTGWIDLDRETPIIFRRGTGEEESKKRRSACLVHHRLLPHLHRWKAQDLAVGVSHVIHHKGQPIREPYHAWESMRIAAGTQTADGPHVLRHSCVTLFVKAKVPLPEIAAFTGMTAAILERYYLHQTLADQENIAQTTHQKPARNGSKRA